MQNKFLSSIINIGAITVFGAFIWGVAVYFNNKDRVDKDLGADIKSYKEETNTRLDSIRLQLKILPEIKKNYDALVGSYRIMNQSYTLHLEKNIKDKGELIEYQKLQIEELKKNE